MKNIIHIIEYSQRGPLWRLIAGLVVFKNHFVLETRQCWMDLCDSGAIYIFHTTGKDYPMISSLNFFIDRGLKCVVFIHTLPDYIIAKGYANFMSFIADIQKNTELIVIVPSLAAQQMFAKFGINSMVVNLGIPAIGCLEQKPYLKKYCGKIISVSTKATDEYKKAKGIDRFTKMIKKNHWESDALILGNNSGLVDNILNIRLPHEDFIYVLSCAKLYVQLSRSESYNISAIEAKQLKVPLIVADIAGHKDSVQNRLCRVKSISEAEYIAKKILCDKYCFQKAVDDNYQKSIAYENIFSFRDRIEQVVDVNHKNNFIYFEKKYLKRLKKDA